MKRTCTVRKDMIDDGICVMIKTKTKQYYLSGVDQFGNIVSYEVVSDFDGELIFRTPQGFTYSGASIDFDIE